tara:strand:+ start:3312 stop:4229 length:918 start_codon:yes stop_codon:yes gene_type:complete
MVAIVTAPYFDGDFKQGYFDYGIYGKVIDARTKFSTSEAARVSKESFYFQYDSDELQINLGSEVCECHEFTELLINLLSKGSVLIDATSLDIPELVLLFKSLLESRVEEYHVFYVEPESYKEDGTFPSAELEYSLSDNFLGFESTGLPEISKPVHNGNCQFYLFAGFEKSRLQSAFELYEMNKSNAVVALGAPGFNLGWENISFSSNLKVVHDNEMIGAIEFTAAGCPASAYAMLLGYLERNRTSDIFVLPLGTKPCSVGALFFVVNHPANVSILFDRPVRKEGRTSGVGKKYIYRLKNAILPDA